MRRSAEKKKRRRKTRLAGAAGPPSARLPLPAKREKRHGDETKYSRAREKRRWREETRTPEGAK